MLKKTKKRHFYKKKYFFKNENDIDTNFKDN